MSAQKIDNTASLRNINDKNYFRFAYDNDYFGRFDCYYSQGFGFELFNPLFRGNFVNLAFPKPSRGDYKYGIGFEHNLFTPTDLVTDTIVPGSRPYAATATLKFMLIATDTIRRQRLSATLGVGVIGPGVFGEHMQAAFHIVIDNASPKGWQYQIRNDLLLNYELAHEREWARLADVFALNSDAQLRLGTGNTNVSGGFSGVLGKINSPYAAREKPFQLYGYAQGLVSLIGYDATLQGGLINRNSPYTLDTRDISRITTQYNYGIVLQWKRGYLELYRTELSKEYKEGKMHKWGGFRMGCKL
jgi:hypothetical protein